MKKKAVTRIGCVLVALLFVGTCFLSASAYSIIIVGYNEGSLYENFSMGQSGDPYDLVVEPGDEIRIPLTANLFEWNDGHVSPPNESIKSIFQIYNSRVKLNWTTLAGSDVLDYVQIDLGNFKGQQFTHYGTNRPTVRTAYISVKFNDDFTDIRDKYFRYRIFLTIDGQKHDELALEIAGEYQFDVDYVEASTEEFDLSEGAIIEAEDSVASIKLDLGAGVTLQKSLNKGERYYGFAYINDSVTDLREEWPELYPDVKIIYQIMHKNLDGGISKATLVPPDGNTYYVYGDDMELLGMTGEAVPFSNYYFLSTTEIPAFQRESYEEMLISTPTSERS